jgi:hypothetical protein
MMYNKCPAEESEGSNVLVEDSAKPRARSVAIHNELLVKVRHLEHWTRGQGALEHLEH